MGDRSRARARARLLDSVSGIGLTSPEVLDVLAGAGVDVLLALMKKNGWEPAGELQRIASLVPEVLFFMRGQTADAGEAMIALLLAVRFITEEGTRVGSPFPEEGRQVH